MTEYDANWLWGIALISVAAGIGLGIVIAYVALPWAQRARKLEKELEGVRAEYDGYRGEVTQHFARTSELFQEMTDRYRAIYEHMASGAQALCRETPETPRLDLPDSGVLPANPTIQPQAEAPGEIPAMQAAAPQSSGGGTLDEEVEANGVTAPPQTEAVPEREAESTEPAETKH